MCCHRRFFGRFCLLIFDINKKYIYFQLNHIPGDDKVGFLLNEGIIKRLDTVLDNNPDQTRVLAEVKNSLQ